MIYNAKRVMLALLLGAVSCSPIPAVGIEVDQDARTLKLTVEEMTNCARGGGCVLVPDSVLQRLLQQAFEVGKKSAEQTCRKDLGT